MEIGFSITQRWTVNKTTCTCTCTVQKVFIKQAITEQQKLKTE